MKKLLFAGAAGLLMTLPGITKASVLTFESNGQQYELLFDPQGSGGANLPSGCYYRSYDCKIGSKPVYPTIVFTPPPPPKGNGNKPGGKTPGGNQGGSNPPGGYTPPPNNNNPGNGGNNPPPDNGGSTPTNGGGDMGGGGCDPASVPTPDASAMAGVGLGAMAVARWFSTRRQSRA